MREREEDFGPLHHGGSTLLIEEGDQSLACLKIHNCLIRLETRIGSERIGRRFHRLLVFRCVSPERMLHPVAQLSEDDLRYVSGTLRDEIDAHPFGADEADYLFNLVEHGL